MRAAFPSIAQHLALAKLNLGTACLGKDFASDPPIRFPRGLVKVFARDIGGTVVTHLTVFASGARPNPRYNSCRSRSRPAAKASAPSERQAETEPDSKKSEKNLRPFTK